MPFVNKDSALIPLAKAVGIYVGSLSFNANGIDPVLITAELWSKDETGKASYLRSVSWAGESLTPELESLLKANLSAFEDTISGTLSKDFKKITEAELTDAIEIAKPKPPKEEPKPWKSLSV